MNFFIMMNFICVGAGTEFEPEHSCLSQHSCQLGQTFTVANPDRAANHLNDTYIRVANSYGRRRRRRGDAER